MYVLKTVFAEQFLKSNELYLISFFVIATKIRKNQDNNSVSTNSMKHKIARDQDSGNKAMDEEKGRGQESGER